MNEKSIGRYRFLAKNTMLYSLASLGSKVVSFFLVSIYTNILTTSEYGIADILSTSATLLVPIFSLNMCDVVLRFAFDRQYDSGQVANYCMRITCAGTIILAIGMAVCYLLDFMHWPLRYYIYLFLMFISTAYEGITFQFLRATDRVTLSVISSLVGATLRPVLCVVFLVVFKWGLDGFIISSILGSVASLLVNAGPFLKAVLFDVAHITTELKIDMIKYAVPGLVNTLGWWVAQGIDRYFIMLMKGPELNGLYAVSGKLSIFITIGTDIFSKAWGISAIKEFDSADSEGFFSRILSIYTFGLCSICSMLILFNISFSRIMFAKDFFEGWRFASLLVLSSVFSALASFLSGIYGAVKRLNTLVVSTFSSAVINIMLNVLLVPHFGAIGAAFSTMLSMYTIYAIRLFNSRKYIKMKFDYIRCHVVFILILLQVIVEQLAGHGYPIQIVLFLVILFISRQECTMVIQGVKKLAASYIHAK